MTEHVNDNENVIPLPTRQRHRRPAAEFYDAAEKADLAVWRVCAYTRKVKEHFDECERCPAIERDERWAQYSDDGSDGAKRMCRALAEEAIAVVLEELAHGHIDLDGGGGDDAA